MAKGTIMAFNKAQQEARDSAAGQMRGKGRSIRDIMAATGQSYARVQATLATAGFITNPNTDDTDD